MVLVFQEVQENVTIVKMVWVMYFPDWNFCNIPSMVPGEGYQLKMSSADTLEYYQMMKNISLLNFQIILEFSIYSVTTVITIHSV